MKPSVYQLPGSRKSAAQRYAANGWAVFPCHSVTSAGGCTCEKYCTRPAKHPRTRRGFYDASTERQKVNKWWGDDPNSNIGFPTGTNAVFVLDVDPQGVDRLADLERQYGHLPVTREAKTGRGRHIYLCCPGIRLGHLSPGLDIQGIGGYVLLPPSHHFNGRRYEWVNEGAIAPAPAWLIQLIQGEQDNQTRPHAPLRGRGNMGHKVPLPTGIIPIGRRNEVIFRKLCSLRRKGADEPILTRCAFGLNQLCEAPLPVIEIKQLVHNSLQYEADPRGWCGGKT